MPHSSPEQTAPFVPPRRGYSPAVWGIIVTALVVYALVAPSPGYENDLQNFGAWMRVALAHGVPHISDFVFCDYPPGYLYLLWSAGKLWMLFTASPLPADGTMALRFLLKSIPALAGVLGALLLYRMARPRLGERAALLVMAAYALNPALVFTGGVWGQVESVTMLLLLLAMDALLARRMFWAGGWLACAVLVKLQVVVLAPILLLSAWFLTNAAGVGVGVLGGGVVAGVLLLPFLLSNRLEAVYAVVHSAAGRYPMLSLYAYNIWWLIFGPRSFALTDTLRVGNTTLSYFTLGLALFALASTLILWQCWDELRRRPDDPMPYILKAAALELLAFYLFPTQMHERYIIPVLVIFAMLCLWWRVIWWLYALLSVAIVLSLVYVLHNVYPASLGCCSRLLVLGLPESYALAAFFCAAFVALFIWKSDRRFLRRACLISGGILIGGVLVFCWLWQPEDVQLADLTPVEANQGSGTLHLNHSVDNNRLSVGNLVFRHGLGTCANSRITYQLNGAFRQFDTMYGQDDIGGPVKRMRFRILVDDQLRFDSGVIKVSGTPRYAAVDVTNARFLTLEVRDAGEGISFDHADWLNPVLYR